MPFHFLKIFTVIFILTVVAMPDCSRAQSHPGTIKYQLAQGYENGGDYETAVRFYQEAYTTDSLNPLFMDAVKRCYLQLKQYDKTTLLLQRWIKRNPNDLNLLSQLGSVFVLKSDEASAAEIWDRAIAVAPDKETTYRIVGSAMIQSRLFDRAIDLFRHGRIACNSPMLFTDDIAHLYSIMLNYNDATREYLTILRQAPARLAYVQANVASYTGRADGLSAAVSVVEDGVKLDPTNVSFHQLLAWLYIEGKQFDRAYRVYKTLDAIMHANGRELFDFAERAAREKSFAVSREAYLDILRTYPDFELVPQVKFGYARSLEEAVSSSDTLLTGLTIPWVDRSCPEKQSRFDTSLAAYQRVIVEHPNTEFAARSLLRIALIKCDKLFNLESARSALEVLIKTYIRFNAIVLDAKFQLGDLYLVSGDLVRAEQTFKMLVEDAGIPSEQRENASFRLAELDYFSNKFEESLKRLTTLTANPISDITNDALDLKIFIRENLSPSDSALREYAHADLIKRQRRYPEALTLFTSIVAHHPKSAIVDEALLNVGDILTVMGRYADAVQSYTQISTDYPESILLDRALMRIALLYQFGLHDSVKAIETYQRLLENFSDSIYINEARKRIRELRGDTL